MEIEELEALRKARPAPPQDKGSLVCIVSRKGGGVHEVVASAELSAERGLEGDRWFDGAERKLDAQITVINKNVFEILRRGEAAERLPGDNLVVDFDLGEAALPIGARLAVGACILEVTPLPHRGCSKFSQRFGPEALRWVNLEQSLRLRGLHARVVQPGSVAVGDAVVRLS